MCVCVLEKSVGVLVSEEVVERVSESTHTHIQREREREREREKERERERHEAEEGLWHAPVRLKKKKKWGEKRILSRTCHSRELLNEFRLRRVGLIFQIL